MAYTNNTAIKELTVSELVGLIEGTINKRMQPLRGVKEICSFLGISKSAFYRLRAEYPRFDRAIIQHSYILLADPNKLMEVLSDISHSSPPLLETKMKQR